MIKDSEIKNILDKDILPFVSKPGRYVGNEINVIHKDLSLIDIRFALAFPEVYEIAMSSQATVILYHLLNKIEFVWAERVFAPWVDMEQRMREHDLPLYALESFSPLKNFDVIGFTLQYEMTYTNILNMLDLAGIPKWSQERSENDPLIIAGGPCSCNPEPIAEFMDAVFIGDAEEAMKEICSVLRQAKIDALTRRETLLQLVKIRGVYVPSFYRVSYGRDSRFSTITPIDAAAAKKVKTRIVPELSNDTYPEKPVVPLIEVTHDRLAVEIMRGCTEGCRYCNAGMIYRPTRERDEDEIVAYTKKALSYSGYEEVSFLSLSTSDYSRLPSLMRKERKALEEKHVNFSFPSMRLDSFNQKIAEFARSVRKSGFTFAPEAGSVRLRRVINKNISDDDLMNAVTIALQYGWKKLKFYFMIGLPTETKEDIEAIVDLLKRVVRLSKGYGKIQLNVSISPFSPKSHTPFQWEKQDTKEEIWGKVDLLRREFSPIRQIKLSWRDAAISEIESILGRGDRRLAQVIYSAWKKGAAFDGWDERFKYDIWVDAFKENKIDRNLYLEKMADELPLPWSHIDKGVSDHFLKREREKAYREIVTVDCKIGTCYGCGIQRKGGFREHADCYKQLQLHNKEQAVAPIQNENQDIKDSVEKFQIHELESITWLRLQFEKQEYARYLSHLDVMRIFDRAFRRSDVRLAFSKGFNPRPKMSFSPALPLGFTSEAEFVDIEIMSKYSKNLKGKLNSVLPDGIKVLNIKRIPKNLPSLTSSINVQEYRIEMAGEIISQQAIGKTLDRHNIIITRDFKGKKKSLDIRPYIESISQENGWLKIQSKVIDGRTARINEILAQFYDSSRTDLKSLAIHRKNQYIRSTDRQNSPMDVS